MKLNLSLILSAVLLLALSGCGGKNEPPTARIIEPANDARGNELTVTFKAESNDPEGKIESAIWSFGDGQQEEAGDEVTHTYAQGGDYTVRYSVTDDKEQTATAALRLSINQAPQAAARAQVEIDGKTLPAVKSVSGETPLPVQFEGSRSKDPDGEVAGYHWDFGDGATSSEANPAHTYQTFGEYAAVLTVTDQEGAEASDKVLVNVSLKPEDIGDYIETSAEVPAYSLISGFTLTGQSVLYRYHMDEQGPFTEEQVKLVLLDVLLNLGQHPEIGRATIYLFSEAKEGFMDPGDYDHYLGMADWERPESVSDTFSLAHHVINNSNLNYNDKYFEGSAPSVVEYELHQAELDPDDPRCTVCETSRVVYVNLTLNPEPGPDEATADVAPAPLCRQQAEATIQAVLRRALLAPGVYGLNVYTGRANLDTGIAVGLWGSEVDINDFPTLGLLFVEPESWDINTEYFRLSFTQELPDCGD